MVLREDSRDDVSRQRGRSFGPRTFQAPPTEMEIDMLLDTRNDLEAQMGEDDSLFVPGPAQLVFQVSPFLAQFASSQGLRSRSDEGEETPPPDLVTPTESSDLDEGDGMNTDEQSTPPTPDGVAPPQNSPVPFFLPMRPAASSIEIPTTAAGPLGPPAETPDPAAGPSNTQNEHTKASTGSPENQAEPSEGSIEAPEITNAPADAGAEHPETPESRGTQKPMEALSRPSNPSIESSQMAGHAGSSAALPEASTEPLEPVNGSLETSNTNPEPPVDHAEMSLKAQETKSGHTTEVSKPLVESPDPSIPLSATPSGPHQPMIEPSEICQESPSSVSPSTLSNPFASPSQVPRPDTPETSIEPPHPSPEPEPAAEPTPVSLPESAPEPAPSSSPQLPRHLEIQEIPEFKPRNLHTCQICLRMLPQDEGQSTFSCPHWLCAGCINAYFKAALRNLSIFPPRCCGRRIIPNRAVITENVRREWEDRIELMDTPLEKRLFCANMANCGLFIPLRRVQSTQRLVECKRCGRVTCKLCRFLWRLCVCPGKTLSNRARDRVKWCPCGECGESVSLLGGNEFGCVL